MAALSHARDTLYHLQDIVAADPNRCVVFGESETDVDRLREIDVVATCIVGGASNWRPEYSEYLRDRDVAILPDNDDPGRKHAEMVAHALNGITASVRIVALPGLPEKGDVSDWLDAGGTRDELAQLVAQAPDVTRVTDVTDSGERETAPDLLLNEAEAFLAKYVVYPSGHARVAHTLWIGHAHLMDSWESTPRLAFLSPEPASGKTRALEVSELLVPRPVEAVNVSAPYLFRKVDDPAGRPTVLFDEVDTVFGPKAREHEDVRGLLNAGHRKGAVAGRCIIKGKNVETVEFPAYCAVAMAGLGDLPDTILTRSVVIRMRRRAPHERAEPFRRRIALKDGDALRQRLEGWANMVQHSIADAWPEMPAGIEDRDADVWEALLAVADAAGGDWPARARAAAVALVAESKQSTPSVGVRLLADLRTVFGDRDAMQTSAILTALWELDEAPWGELVAGKPLNSRGLSKRLKGYGIGSKSVRIGDAVERGYTREDLSDAWVRYLSTPRSDPDDSGAPSVSLSLRTVTNVTNVTAIDTEEPVGVAGDDWYTR